MDPQVESCVHDESSIDFDLSPAKDTVVPNTPPPKKTSPQGSPLLFEDESDEEEEHVLALDLETQGVPSNFEHYDDSDLNLQLDEDEEKVQYAQKVEENDEKDENKIVLELELGESQHREDGFIKDQHDSIRDDDTTDDEQDTYIAPESQNVEFGKREAPKKNTVVINKKAPKKYVSDEEEEPKAKKSPKKSPRSPRVAASPGKDGATPMRSRKKSTKPRVARSMNIEESQTVTTTTTTTTVSTKKSASKQMKEIMANAKKEAVQEVQGETPSRSRKDRNHRIRTIHRDPNLVDSGILSLTQEESPKKSKIELTDSDSNDAFAFEDLKQSSDEEEEAENTDEEQTPRVKKSQPSKGSKSPKAKWVRPDRRKSESKYSFFDGYNFILTSPVGNSQNEERKEIQRMVTECGGNILQQEELMKNQSEIDGSDLSDRPTILLATKEYTSIKYLLGLAMDVPLLHFQYMRDCYEQGKKIDPSTNPDYWLPCGKIKQDGKENIIKQTPDRDMLSGQFNQRVFYNNTVLVSGSYNFVSTFSPLMRVAGANVYEGNDPKVLQKFKKGDFVLLEDTRDKENYKRVMDAAIKRKIPAVTREYVFNSLIEGSRIDYDEYNTYNYDVVYQSKQPKATESGSPRKNKLTPVSETHTTDEDSQSSQEPITPAALGAPVTPKTPKKAEASFSAKKSKKATLEPGDYWTSRPVASSGKYYYSSYSRIDEDDNAVEFGTHDTVWLKLNDGKKVIGVIEELFEDLTERKKMVGWRRFFKFNEANPDYEGEAKKTQLYLSDWHITSEISSILSKSEVFHKNSKRPTFYCEHTVNGSDPQDRQVVDSAFGLWNEPGETTKDRVISTIKTQIAARQKVTPSSSAVSSSRFASKFQWCEPIQMQNEIQTYSSCIVDGLFLQLNSNVKITVKDTVIIGKITEMKEKTSTQRRSLYVEKYAPDADSKNEKCLEKSGAEVINVADVSSVEQVVILPKKAYDVFVTNNKNNKDALKNVFFV
jgi:hypothetical protein